VDKFLRRLLSRASPANELQFKNNTRYVIPSEAKDLQSVLHSISLHALCLVRMTIRKRKEIPCVFKYGFLENYREVLASAMTPPLNSTSSSGATYLMLT
jgi:hypothetical protein